MQKRRILADISKRFGTINVKLWIYKDGFRTKDFKQYRDFFASMWETCTRFDKENFVLTTSKSRKN
eukprot:UN11742